MIFLFGVMDPYDVLYLMMDIDVRIFFQFLFPFDVSCVAPLICWLFLGALFAKNDCCMWSMRSRITSIITQQYRPVPTWNSVQFLTPNPPIKTAQVFCSLCYSNIFSYKYYAWTFNSHSYSQYCYSRILWCSYCISMDLETSHGYTTYSYIMWQPICC